MKQFYKCVLLSFVCLSGQENKPLKLDVTGIDFKKLTRQNAPSTPTPVIQKVTAPTQDEINDQRLLNIRLCQKTLILPVGLLGISCLGLYMSEKHFEEKIVAGLAIAGGFTGAALLVRELSALHTQQPWVMAKIKNSLIRRKEYENLIEGPKGTRETKRIAQQTVEMVHRDRRMLAELKKKLGNASA